MKTKNKKNRALFSVKNGIFAVLMSFILLFSPSHQAHAALWPAVDPIIKQGLEEVADRIKGIILGMLKQQAAKMLNAQVNKLVGGGSSGSAMFITDWKGYLVKTPEQNTKVYMNDYLSRITSGRGSMSGYIPAGVGGLNLSGLVKGASDSKVPGENGQVAGVSSLMGEGFGSFSNISTGGGNYVSQLLNIGKRTTTEKPELKVTYEGNPTQMFAQGNFKNLELYLSGINNPWAFSINAQSEYQKKLAEEKKIAETKAVANNAFKSVGEGKNGKGTVSMPGSLVKENVANVQDIGNKIIANATHPEEIITSIVSQMITKAMQTGMSMVNQQLNSITNKAMGQLNSVINQNGPGAGYKGNSSNMIQQFSPGGAGFNSTISSTVTKILK